MTLALSLVGLVSAAALLIACADAHPSVLALLPMLPIVVGVEVLTDVSGVSDAATLQKAGVVATIVLCAALSGVARPPRSVIGIVAFALASMVIVELWPADFLPEVAAAAPKAAAGYVYPWLVFVIGRRKLKPVHWMTALEALPYAAVVVGILLQLAGIRPLIETDYTGAHRLTAGLPAAYMGAIAMFGCAASLWRWQKGRDGSFWLACVSLLLTFASGTRGASIVAAFLIVWVLLTGRIRGKPLPFSAKAALVAGGGVVMYALVPLLAARTEDQGAAQGQLSGRGAAWPYFWAFVERHPFLGNGVGANSQLGALSSDTMIQESFVAPHNTYLQLAVDFGIPVAILFLALIGAVFVATFRTSRNAVSRRLLIGVAIALAFYAFFDNLLAAPQPAVLMPILLLAMARDITPAPASLGYPSPRHAAPEVPRLSARRDVLASRTGSP